jgi:hypothetical protein
MEIKIWRTAAIVALIACLLLGIGLILALRVEKVKIVTVKQTQVVNRNVYIKETYDPKTGNLTGRETTDKTQTTDRTEIKDKETEKPLSKTFTITAGYNLKEGTLQAGAGVILFNFITIQAINPVALKFQPTILASIQF